MSLMKHSSISIVPILKCTVSIKPEICHVHKYIECAKKDRAIRELIYLKLLMADRHYPRWA